MGESVCRRCGVSPPGSRGVHLSEEGSTRLGGLGFHCHRCAGEVIAERRGEPFSWLEVAPILVEDARGTPHVFHFEYHTTGPLPTLWAVELLGGEPEGHRIAVCSEPGETGVSLVGRLLGKIRRELRRTHVEDDPRVTLGMAIRESVLRGRIDFDPDRGGPCDTRRAGDLATC